MSKSKKDRMTFETTLLDAPIKRKRTVRDNKFFWSITRTITANTLCTTQTKKTSSKTTKEQHQLLYPEIDYQ